MRVLRPRLETRLPLAAVALTVLLNARFSLAGSCPGGGNFRTTIGVTTYFSAADANGYSATISEDGGGAYRDGVDGVSSFLTANGYNCIRYGDWQFGTYDSPSRAVAQSLLPEDAVQPGDPHYQATANPPIWGTQALKAHIEVKCTLIFNDMLSMKAGSSFNCPLINRFAVNGADYRLDAGYSFTHYPETTDAQVRCNTSDAGGCNDWFIDPINQQPAVGRLIQLPVRGNSQPLDDGDFFMRFHIHVTRP